MGFYEQLNRNLYYYNRPIIICKTPISLCFSISLKNANSKIVVKEEVL
jgi:hypothetical protein